MGESYFIWIALLVYFLVISFLSSLNPVYISVRKIYLFRCLFPSWKFYEDICYVPVLYYRLSEDGESFKDWCPLFDKLERSWKNFFINPEANLRHAYNTLLQQLESDKEEISEERKSELASSVSYLLTKNLVNYRLRDIKSSMKYFQFKLSLEMQGSSLDREDIIFSLVHEVE